MATAQILFHRFFYCKSFVRHCAEVRHLKTSRLSLARDRMTFNPLVTQTVAMACLQLASKIEEEPRRVRDVLNVFHHLKHSAGNR